MKRFALVLSGVALMASGASLAATNVDFVKEIQPILEGKCISCHGAKKVKGKLRLDTKEFTFKEREMPAIVAGNASESELYRRITLPAGDDDIMPNEGDPLTKTQTDLILEWIKQGAVWPDGVVLGAEEAARAEAAALPEAPKPTEAELAAIAALEAIGVSARPIAMNVGWREANFYLLGTNVTDESLAPLKSVPSLMHVNLANTGITDAGLASVSGLVNLRRLHLEKTSVTDAGLPHLQALVNLRYLNLYGTSVSDAGLENLKGLKSLKSLYLWQTKVTDEGVSGLQKELPDLEIVRGWDLASVAKEEPEKESDKKEETEK
ncbi:MAG: hypothetical protein O2960_10805 [Verrucomicrobia bacterium]|nr:hypothetical protein [Verrucomicrobiota bacterium]